MAKILITNLSKTSYQILAGTSQDYELNLNHFNCDASLVQELVFVLEQAAFLNLKLIGLGELVINLVIKLEFAGIDSHANLTGKLLLNQNSQVKINVLQNHVVPNCESWVQIKTVLDDFSQFDYTGKILILSGANGTVAHQENKNIVLSANTFVRSEPSIEVLNFDVACSHGSATGELDREQLIYLTSRGLKHDFAQKILIESFLA